MLESLDRGFGCPVLAGRLIPVTFGASLPRQGPGMLNFCCATSFSWNEFDFCALRAELAGCWCWGGEGTLHCPSSVVSGEVWTQSRSCVTLRCPLWPQGGDSDLAALLSSCTRSCPGAQELVQVGLPGALGGAMAGMGWSKGGGRGRCIITRGGKTRPLLGGAS